MKKIFCLTIFCFLFNFLNSCGYQPIFSSKNINLQIIDYSISGNEKLGQKIYSKLKNIIQSTDNGKEVFVYIDSSTKKTTTVTNNAGQVSEYKITFEVEVKFKEIATDNFVSNYNTTITQNFKVQEQLSLTESIENSTVENLINRSVQEILINLSKNNSY